MKGANLFLPSLTTGGRKKIGDEPCLQEGVLVKGWILLALVCVGADVRAQINSWTNPASGNWEVPTNWSAGLPNAVQFHVCITNAASKAVAIQPDTPINFPD